MSKEDEQQQDDATIEKTVDKVDDKHIEAVEAEARGMGWMPEAEFRGDKTKWRGAQEFVDRGRNLQGIMRESNKKMEARLRKLEGDLAEKDKVIGEIREFNGKTEERAYTRALETLKSQRREAVEKGDGKAFEEVDAQITELEGARPKKQPAQQQRNGGVSQTFVEWQREQEWFGKNDKASAYAVGIGEKIRRDKPGMSEREFLDEVAKQTREDVPHLFEDGRRTRPAQVEGAGNGGQRRSGKKSGADLPDDARKQGEAFVRQKLFKSIDDYARDYFAQGE